MSNNFCPRCGGAIDPPERIFCQSCGTPHHWNCYDTDGCAMQSCASFGVRPGQSPIARRAGGAVPSTAAAAAAPQLAPAAAHTSPPQVYTPPYYPKSRLAYILLGIFVGTLGIHNFYAGYTGRGVAQLLITVLTFGLGGVITFIWAVVEVCTINVDARGVAFTN